MLLTCAKLLTCDRSSWRRVKADNDNNVHCGREELNWMSCDEGVVMMGWDG